MRVVLFSGGDDKRGCKHLEMALKTVVPEQALEVFTKFEIFSVRIRRLHRDIDVAVLSVQNNHQLTACVLLWIIWIPFASSWFCPSGTAA